jgi:polysaccharide biosynthesis transport protein
MAHHTSTRDIIQTFLRRKVLFTLTCGLVLLAGGTYLLLAQPIYLSNASLVLHFDTQTVPDIDRNKTPTQMQGSNEHREILYSDADILRSPDRARKVIETIGLARLYPKIAASHLDNAGKMDQAERAFDADLVINVSMQSDVLSLSFFNPDPIAARDALQQLIDQFFAQEAAVYANPQLKFAQEEANAAREKLTAAQNELADFKSRNAIADLPQQVQQLLLSRTDVESRMRVAQGRLLEAEQRQDALKQLLDSIPASISSSAMGEQYRAVDDAETRLDQLRAKRSEMAANYLPGSELFKQVDAQIAALTNAAKARTSEARGRSVTQPNVVYQSIKTDYVRAAADAASARQPQQVLAQQLAQMNDRLNDLEARRTRYDDLTRTVQIQNDTYRTLAIRHETARVEANRNAQGISAAVVIAAPAVSNLPARPRRKLVALVTVFAALLSGLAIVLAVEGFDDRIRSSGDIKRILRVPVLATFTPGE